VTKQCNRTILVSMLAKLLKRPTDNALVQLLRYTVVGGVAFVIDIGSLYALTEYAGVYYLQSAALAFLLGLTTNYLLSIRWVFSNRTLQNKSIEYGIFALLGVAGLGLNHGLIYFLTERAGFHYLFSKVVATGAVFLWNFGSRKLTLFNSRPRNTAELRPAITGRTCELPLVRPMARDASTPVPSQS
jgi:putative flippase GtrA